MQPVAKLSPLVCRILGLNPGMMTLDGTNTYLVGTGSTRLLIDTGDGKMEYLDLLKETLKEENVETLRDVILTHHHPDHVGGVENIKSIFPNAKFWKFCVDASDKWSSQTQCLHDGQIFSVENATIRVIQTPGHTDDHVSLILEEENALFSGDCILGRGSAVFEDLKTYMESLNKLCDEDIDIIYPGHGPVVNEGKKKIIDYINHRNAREKMILNVLQNNSPLSALGIVKLVYTDIPEHLYKAAAGNVKLHLGKLVKEHKVIQKGDDLWSSNFKSNL